MWDIVWTDPNRELVGEHRAKKESRKNRVQDGSVPIARSSLSSAASSSRSSKTESAFARFRPRGLKKPKAKCPPEHASLHLPRAAFPSPASASVSGSTTSTRSSASVTGDVFSSLLSTPASCSRSRASKPATSSESTRDDPLVRPAIYSSDSLSSRVPATPRSRLARIIGSTALSPSRPARAPPCSLQSAFVADRLFPGEPLTPPRSPTDDFAVPGRFADLSNSLPPSLASRIPRPAQPDPPAKSPLRFRTLPRPGPCTLSPPHGSGQWGAASAQARVKMTAEPAKSPLAVTTPSGLRQFWKPPDFDAYVREVKSMAAATPATILARLQEPASPAAEQPSQPEVERMRWMLSALHHLDVAPAPSGPFKPQPTQKIAPEKMHNILALYESRASASYLAGLHPTKRICHLSDKPLPMDALPNVQPLVVSTTSPSTFPIPPGLFEAVYALSLPSVCSSQDLRGIVRNVSSSLKPGGTFYLVVIDPLPCVDTLGWRMREWLEEHLLANLENQSMCTDPTARLPQWLGEASLRGAGSVLTTVKFYASAENVRRLPRDPDPVTERAYAERRTKAELRSLVGRMLWRTVWGEHMKTDSWWWDDDECVQECVELGTFWEYHLIEAVKGS